ncbi:MAG: AMP-binding protein [Marinisporobacter sp.]|jgi:non-ribosomal peptide synthetase component F|nr:AMP-binding protein [Marinisporobacter sp.]
MNKSNLRVVMLSGDWIPLKLPNKIKDNFKEAQVVSLGGATEASIWSIRYPVTEVKDSWKTIPYGKPLKNQRFYILNKELGLCPVGVKGELYIGGRGVATGYMNDEEKTTQAFIYHPKLGYIYKTGDYGILHRDGYIEFMGRKDQQVKIKGYRIELGEIENKIRQYSKVRKAAVLDHTDENGRKYLCAYIVSDLREYDHIRK